MTFRLFLMKGKQSVMTVKGQEGEPENELYGK
jgi:hypothetical protein